MDFWRNKKVLVTGGGGFIGSHLVEELVKREACVRVADYFNSNASKNLKKVKTEIELIEKDLNDFKNCLAVSKDQEIVLNLAAKVGGVEFNRKYPGTLLRDNTIVGFNMLEASRLNKAERFLVVSSACVYPRHCTIPTPEEEGFKDNPEPTNLGYGWAKRILEIQAQVYSQEFGMKIAIIRPFNTYGPRNCFDPERAHVIPALIMRIFNGENPLNVWGDGEQSRAFLYVEDLVEGLLKTIEKYPVCSPLNIGTAEEIKIKDLVKLIIRLSGKNPEILFDTSRPSGQPRRNCATAKAKEMIGFVAKINIEEGIKRTIEWYKNEFIK